MLLAIKTHIGPALDWGTYPDGTTYLASPWLWKGTYKILRQSFQSTRSPDVRAHGRGPTCLGLKAVLISLFKICLYNKMHVFERRECIVLHFLTSHSCPLLRKAQCTANEESVA